MVLYGRLHMVRVKWKVTYRLLRRFSLYMHGNTQKYEGAAK